MCRDVTLKLIPVKLGGMSELIDVINTANFGVDRFRAICLADG